MMRIKKCFCCDEDVLFSKKNIHKRKQVKFKELTPLVSLVRLEDDPKLETIDSENGIKISFKKGSSSSPSKISMEPSNEIKNSATNNNIADKFSSGFLSCGKLKIKEVAAINKVSLDVEENVEFSQPQTERANSKKPLEMSSEKIEKKMDSSKNLEEREENVSHEVKINEKDMVTVGSDLGRKHENKLCNKTDLSKMRGTSEVLSVSCGKKTQVLINEVTFSSPKKSSLKRKISQDIEEPLTLISKLTGCQIPPSKVKVLPLTSCISCVEPKNDLTLSLPKNLNCIDSEEKFSSSNSKINGTNHQSNCNLTLPEEKQICFEMKSVTLNLPEKLNSGENENRTVYDVMECISVVMPSWNLHILPDTNTFCICQITRDRRGVPSLSKCIELDDSFNGKVHVFGQHCERFDGVYNSEESVVALIREVDEIC